MMATPRAPPTWRVVSFTAEPTPALASGSDPITESVAGAITSPIPAARITNRHAMSKYAVSTRSPVINRSARAASPRPSATVNFEPKRSTTRELVGATTIIVTAYGNRRMPDSSGV